MLKNGEQGQEGKRVRDGEKGTRDREEKGTWKNAKKRDEKRQRIVVKGSVKD